MQERGERWVAHDWRWDPRPDLVSDHELWKLLLTQVVDDEETGLTLNGARCAGCTLKWENGTYHIVPIIDPRLGFDSEQDWLEFREKWLVPMGRQIAAYLRQLAAQMKGKRHHEPVVLPEVQRWSKTGPSRKKPEIPCGSKDGPSGPGFESIFSLQNECYVTKPQLTQHVDIWNRDITHEIPEIYESGY